MLIPQLHDYEWLTSPAAASWLELASSHDADVNQLATRLRRELTPARTHLVLGQVALRRRAGAKFSHAERMFFTDQGLQQSTDELIANFKARQLPAGHVLDLCSGIGGDLMAIAGRGPVSGYDLDPISAQLSRVNAMRVSGRVVTVHVAHCGAAPVESCAAWHIDPDRRTGGRRHAQLAGYQPDPSVISALLKRNPHALLKLAPAARCPDRWQLDAELEWIGHHRQCQQLLVRHGNLAGHVGCRRATILAHDGQDTRTVRGPSDDTACIAETIARYIFEPHPAVRAAGLTDVVAAELKLDRVSAEWPYLTGDEPVHDLCVACFEVLAHMPVDLKRMRAYVRQQAVGRLEIKSRLARHDPQRLRQQLSPRGPHSMTLMLVPMGDRARAVFARRLARISHVGR